MNLFFDTSALVKLFHDEEGSEAVEELIFSNNKIWVSELARIELLSAFFRRFRMREIDSDMLQDALSGANEQFQDFNIIPIAQITFKEAEKTLNRFGKKYGLRTLDAIQLSAYIMIAKNDWEFVSADKCLLTVARIAGCRTINPI